MKWFWRHKFLFLILLTLVGASAYLWRINRTTSDLPANSGTVTPSDLVQRVTISGAIVPERTTLIQAPYDGYVQKVFVKVGDNVKLGQPIISISPTANTDAANESFPLRASFDGVVTQILKSEGQFVSKSNTGNNESALIRIDDLAHMQVKADVAEMDYPKLKTGQEVIIKATSIQDRTYKGYIRTIARASKMTQSWDRTRVEFEVTVPFRDADARIFPGMSALVDVITFEAKNILVIRHEFIQRDKDKYFVILQDGKRKDIEVGAQNEEVFEIKSGVAEGAKIKPTDFLKM